MNVPRTVPLEDTSRILIKVHVILVMIRPVLHALEPLKPNAKHANLTSSLMARMDAHNVPMNVKLVLELNQANVKHVIKDSSLKEQLAQKFVVINYSDILTRPVRNVMGDA